MDIIKNMDIQNALDLSGRVYLCGNLKNENGVDHLQTDGHEIGISEYSKYTFEKAHVHTFNREYNYVVEGNIKIFLLNEEKEYHFQKGDFFMINMNEPYVGKCMQGTKIIFLKLPGGNDKILVPMSETLMQWGSSWESVYKKEELK